MRPLLAPFLVTLAASLAGVLLAGPNLGAVFALVAIIAIATPVFSARATEAFAAVLAIFIAATTLVFRDILDTRQLLAVLIALVSFALLLAALTRVIGVALAITLAIVWLACPIWLSPWMTDSLAGPIVKFHPLIALNAAVPQHGFWLQGRLMYHLTNLGQDVLIDLPTGVAASAVFHTLIAIAILLPLAGWTWWSRRRADTAAPS